MATYSTVIGLKLFRLAEVPYALLKLLQVNLGPASFHERFYISIVCLHSIITALHGICRSLQLTQARARTVAELRLERR